jgi:tetratricopeptide (TPR) repeat protein
MSDTNKKLAVLVLLVIVAGALGWRANAQYQDIVASEGLFLDGEKLAHEQKFREAIDTYKRSYTRNPLYFPSYEAAADLEFSQFRDTRKAIEILETAQARCPQDPRVLKGLGEYYYRAQLPEYRQKAVTTLERASAADPKDQSLAALLAKARQAAEASR